jgi:hypothetical protein
MGVTHALDLDGGRSATLIIDGTVYADPETRNNFTIPIGLAFELSDLIVGGTGAVGTFEVQSADQNNNDPNFIAAYPINTTWNGFEGYIAALNSNDGGGLRFTVASLGDKGDLSPSIIAKMGLSVPLYLHSDSTDLKSGVTFTDQSTNPTITLKATARKPANPKTDPNDYIEGTVEVNKNGHQIRGNIRAAIRN